MALNRARILGLSLLVSVAYPAFAADPRANPEFPIIPDCRYYVSKFLKKPVRYCLDRSRYDVPRESGEPVVFFMHGAFQGALQWYTDDYAPPLREIGIDEKFPAFTVVSFDTSGMSFFSDEGDESRGSEAFETWFIDEFMDHVSEKHDLCQRRSCRSVIGVSMGGYGALKTGLKHPELFRAVGANFGAILPRNIYAWTLDEWKAYFSTKKIGGTVGKAFIQEMRRIFPTPELYDANDPVVLASRWSEPSRFPALYFDVGENDEFGFNDGFHRFKEALDTAKLPYVSRFEPNGDHFSSPELSYSLLRWVAETLKTEAPMWDEKRHPLSKY